MLAGRVADHLEVIVVGVARLGGVALLLRARLLGHEHHIVGMVLQDVARSFLLARRALQVGEDAVLLLLRGRIGHRLSLRVEPADDRPLAEFDLLARCHILPPLFSPNAWNGGMSRRANPSAASVVPCERGPPCFAVGVTTNSSPSLTTSAENPPLIVRRKKVLPARCFAAADVIWNVRSSKTVTPSPHVDTSASATTESCAPPAKAMASGIAAVAVKSPHATPARPIVVLFIAGEIIPKPPAVAPPPRVPRAQEGRKGHLCICSAQCIPASSANANMRAPSRSRRTRRASACPQTALLLVVGEIRPVRHPRDEMAALARPDDPFLLHDAVHSTKSTLPPSCIYSKNIYRRV